MHEPPSLLMLEFLTSVSSRERTDDETMDAWRSTRPRHTIWEDALIDGLIQVARGEAGQQSQVALTPRGRALLESNLGRRPLGNDPRVDAHSP
jgi:hypothetical protein